ncbi:hypothetical protein [Photorhabdus africana]|uniref:hypothetical protein n=1 Tax=Photorhabdus africana TaxID=3097554 RepID=UPI002B4113F9|nr:hypothetical protein [Photorhabdus sp. CRI-LC]
MSIKKIDGLLGVVSHCCQFIDLFIYPPDVLIQVHPPESVLDGEVINGAMRIRIPRIVCEIIPLT